MGKRKVETTKASVRPAQERGKRTRELLLATAIDSLANSNLYGLRFAQISKAANVPQALMDYHFPSLESLLIEMVSLELEKLKLYSLEAIQKYATKPRKALEAYIRAPFELAAADRGFCAVWSCYYHLATVNQTFADFNRGVRKMGNERILMLVIGVLNSENKSEYLSKTKLTQDVSTSLQALITGYGFMASADSDRRFKEFADLAAKAAAQILAANFP